MMADQTETMSTSSGLAGKRICIISPAAYPLLDSSCGGGWSGGAEAQFITIGREFSRRGMDVHYVVGDYGQPDLVSVDGMTIHRATFRYMGGSNKYVLPDWLRLFRILRRIHADYHLIKVPRHLLQLLGVYCKLYGGHLIFVGQKDTDLDEKVIRSQEGAPGWWLYRMGMSLTSAVVAQTETQQAGFQKVFGKPAVVIRNVLTLESDDNLVKEDYVLWVGNSSDDKQSHLVPELARALPNVHFRMIMALSPSRRDDSFIREQSRELPNLDYLGAVPFSQMAQHYKGARLFISTSKCEGFPNTFLQSWQYRTPVVSLLVDPDEVIGRYQLGRLSVSMSNMVRDIEELCSNEALCEKLGRNAHKYAYEFHSQKAALDGYNDLLVGLR